MYRLCSLTLSLSVCVSLSSLCVCLATLKRGAYPRLMRQPLMARFPLILHHSLLPKGLSTAQYASLRFLLPAIGPGLCVS